MLLGGWVTAGRGAVMAMFMPPVRSLGYLTGLLCIPEERTLNKPLRHPFAYVLNFMVGLDNSVMMISIIKSSSGTQQIAV